MPVDPGCDDSVVKPGCPEGLVVPWDDGDLEG